MKWNSHLFLLCLYLDGMLQSQRGGWEFNKYLRFWNDNSNIFVWWPTVNSIFKTRPFSPSLLCSPLTVIHSCLYMMKLLVWTLKNMNSVASLWNVSLLCANICPDPFTQQSPRVTSYFQEVVTFIKWIVLELKSFSSVILEKLFIWLKAEFNVECSLHSIPQQPCDI